MDFSWWGKIFLNGEKKNIYFNEKISVVRLLSWKTFPNPVGAETCTLLKLSCALLNSPQGDWAVTLQYIFNPTTSLESWRVSFFRSISQSYTTCLCRKPLGNCHGNRGTLWCFLCEVLLHTKPLKAWTPLIHALAQPKTYLNKPLCCQEKDKQGKSPQTFSHWSGYGFAAPGHHL